MLLGADFCVGNCHIISFVYYSFDARRASDWRADVRNHCSELARNNPVTRIAPSSAPAHVSARPASPQPAPAIMTCCFLRRTLLTCWDILRCRAVRGLHRRGDEPHSRSHPCHARALGRRHALRRRAAGGRWSSAGRAGVVALAEACPRSRRFLSFANFAGIPCP